MTQKISPRVLERINALRQDRIRALRAEAQKLTPDDGIDWYALSNGLGTVMPDGTVIPPEEL